MDLHRATRTCQAVALAGGQGGSDGSILRHSGALSKVHRKPLGT